MNDNNELLVKEEPTRPSRLRIFGTTCIGIVLALVFLFVVFVPTVDKFGQFPRAAAASASPATAAKSAAAAAIRPAVLPAASA